MRWAIGAVGRVEVVAVVAVNEPEFAGKMDHWSWMEKLTDVQTVDISDWIDHRPICPVIDCTGLFYCLAKWTVAWVQFRGFHLAYKVVLIVFGFCIVPQLGKFAVADPHRRSRCPYDTDCTGDWG